MNIIQKIQQRGVETRRLPKKVVIPVCVAGVALPVYVAAFFVDKPIQFAYQDTTCVRQLTVLPATQRQTSGDAFTVTYPTKLSIGNLPLISAEACFSPNEPPRDGVSRVTTSPWGGLVARKTFAISVPSAPLADTAPLRDPVPVSVPLTLALTAPDAVFDYKLAVGPKMATCESRDAMLSCDVPTLGLVQGKRYSVELKRSFNEQHVETVIDHSITTLTATALESSSLKNGATVYHKPRSFVFVFDKPIKSVETSLVQERKGEDAAIETKTLLDGRRVIVKLAADLPREERFRLTMSRLVAGDGSTLIKPYTSQFKTSDGPSVTTVEGGGTGIASSGVLTLHFDQPLEEKQDVSKLLSISGARATIAASGDVVTIHYSGAKKCGLVRVTLQPGIKSKHGIVQKRSWSHSSRAACYTTTIVGHSRQGRPIVAYSFGDGDTPILMVGAIHGNEVSSKYVLDDWVKELNARAADIPKSRKIIIVPSMNPDGVAAGTRNNSKNVDLNRNFDDGWKRDVQKPVAGGGIIKGGGGTKPLSEPESAAIAALTQRLRPRVTIQFHAVASYVFGNLAGDSAKLSARYASLTGYSDMTYVDDAFGYTTSGTYEGWMARTMKLPCLVVELSSYTNNEFARNKTALWDIIKS